MLKYPLEKSPSNHSQLLKNAVFGVLAAFSLSAFTPLDLPASTGESPFKAEELIKIGTFYYPEHWDESQWERDIKHIADLGLEFFHMGEFAWATLEPEEGHYDFSFLDKSIALAEKYGLKVILCSTTATPPAWLTNKHPQILRIMEDGTPLAHGRRQHASFSNDFYRDYSLKLVEKLAQRYGNNPTVIGWQLDNEPKGNVDYSENAKRRFQDWLKNKYGTIDSLNEAWGNAFWSMTYNGFYQIELPRRGIGMRNPHQFLDHKRFMAYETASHMSLQSETIHKYASENQWITTNFTNDQSDADPRLNKDLDFIAFTTYPVDGYHSGVGEDGFRRGDPHYLPYAVDYYRPIGGTTGIMELQPGQVNWGRIGNPLLEPGIVRMWLWHVYAAGCDFACTYRFRQPLYGSELYHYGIIGTDGVTPSYSGVDFSTFAGEIRKLRKEYDPNRKGDAAFYARKTGLLTARDNRWDIADRPLSEKFDYKDYIEKNYYAQIKSFGAPVDFIDEEMEFSQYPVIVAPAYMIVDSDLVAKWKAYAEQGGHLVLSSRSGTKDRRGQYLEGPYAVSILDLIGADLFGHDIMIPPAKGAAEFQGENYPWGIWADILEPRKGTDTLSTYENSFYKGKAAVTYRKLGKGSVTYIGPYTNDGSLEKAVLREVYTRAGIAVEDLPPGVMMEYRDGFGIAVNYSDTEYEVPAPADAEFIFGGRTIGISGVSVWK